MNTWVDDVVGLCDVQFVMSAETRGQVGVPADLAQHVVYVDAPESYPPQPLVFALWKHNYLQCKATHRYLWYFKMDSDTFVHAAALRRTVRALNALGSTNVYRGMQGRGRPHEREKLGLNGNAYCLGPGYVIGHDLLLSLGPHLDSCIRTVRTDHSDTEVGRCVFTATDGALQCETMPAAPLVHLYYGFEMVAGDPNSVNGAAFRCVDRSKLAKNYQTMAFAVKYIPHMVMRQHAFFHPITKAESFEAIYRSIHADLAPVLPPLSCHGQYAKHLRSNKDPEQCIHNPAMHVALYGGGDSRSGHPRECASPVHTLPMTISTVPAFVLTMSDAKFERTKRLLLRFGFHDVRRWAAVVGWDVSQFAEPTNKTTSYMPRALTPGELGVRESYRQLITHAAEQQFTQIAVFEDDILLDCDIEARWQEVMADERCCGHLWTEERGGIVLLGSRMRIEGFEHADREMAEQKASAGRTSQCFNQVPGNLGAFAWMAHRSTFRSILDWLDSSYEPFDWMWSDLAKIGHIVRSVYPPVAIADLNESSTVDTKRPPQHTGDSSWIKERHAMHRWNLRTYCTSLV